VQQPRDEAGEADREKQQTADVEGWRFGLTGLRHEAHSQPDGERHHRDVEQEDPAPAHRLHQQPAQQRADHQAGGPGAGQYADDPAAPLGRHDRRRVGERQRLGERRACALYQSCDDQREIRRSHRAGHGRQPKQSHSHKEQPPAAEEVG
jgi:hypothetical protein